MTKIMSLAVKQEALHVAEHSETLAQNLGDGISSCIDVSQLRSCLVNRLAGSLRSLTGLIPTSDKLLDQELDYFESIQNAVSNCANILADVQAYLDAHTAGELAVATASNEESPMKRFERDLFSESNSLAVAQHLLARKLSGRNSVAAKKIPLILQKLETACKFLLDSKIFPAIRSYPPNSSSTFELHEARKSGSATSSRRTSYNLKCPHAGFPSVESGPLDVKFRCFCEYRRHDAEITYDILSEGSIPIEELRPVLDGFDITWSMFLRKESEEVSVRLSQFQGLSLDPSALPNFVERLRSTCTRMLIASSFNEANISSEVVKLSPLSMSILRAKLHAVDLAQRLREVEFHFGKRYIIPWEPGYLQMLHYATASRASVHALGLSAYGSIFSDESSFCIFFSDRSPASWSPEDAPLESFSIREVTVTNVYCIHEGVDPASSDCSEVHFRFNSAPDAKSFYDRICHMKDNIFNLSLRRAFLEEETVYRQDFDSLASESPEFAGAHFNLVHDAMEKGHRYRMIMTRDKSPRAICFYLEPSLFDGMDVDLTTALKSQAIRTADISGSGEVDVDRVSWDQLVAIGDDRHAPARAGTGVGTAALKSDSSSAAEQWFVKNIEELNCVIRAKANLKEKGENYKRVKIAVIDTGLIPSHHMAKKVTYRDFVAEKAAAETKNKGDHSAKVDPKDKAPQALQDTSDSKHGTISVGIILRVYEDAELYVARVFEHEDATETREPLLMADAINWAVENQVDIISISAGFKTCPLPLRNAIHTAYTSHTLIFAAASNWGNNDLVAFPARIRDQVFCIFATDSMLGRTRYDPEPRVHADNFAILGEDIRVDGGTRLGQGTSAATAVMAGFAARILDFVSQKGVADGLEGVELLKTKAGMTAVFKRLVMSSGFYECIRPGKLLKDRKYDPKKRAAFREHVKETLVTALKNVE
ncbi:hypothetical protein HZS61_011476 [Fusarium oxysporum f. sp. conglutinans]|uniref:Peptidase S8/S53 domain-containing protein n=1 Tax=Fusarium oxysporum f. sp. conglutinans TaxID=100902 RepID=A0A8H6GXW7_FUSOX|nr:hypothetical protein HZS61_011476 [Fusarium oxysporum f. sp. conglutinans]